MRYVLNIIMNLKLSVILEILEDGVFFHCYSMSSNYMSIYNIKIITFLHESYFELYKI